MENYTRSKQTKQPCSNYLLVAEVNPYRTSISDDEFIRIEINAPIVFIESMNEEAFSQKVECETSGDIPEQLTYMAGRHFILRVQLKSGETKEIGTLMSETSDYAPCLLSLSQTEKGIRKFTFERSGVDSSIII